jgi:hypothetical protein
LPATGSGSAVLGRTDRPAIEQLNTTSDIAIVFLICTSFGP